MRVNLSNIDHVKHNGVECDRVIFNGVEVWRKYATVTGKIVQFQNLNAESVNATVEIKGDYPEGTTFELTHCGRNLFYGEPYERPTPYSAWMSLDGILAFYTVDRYQQAEYKLTIPAGGYVFNSRLDSCQGVSNAQLCDVNSLTLLETTPVGSFTLAELTTATPRYYGDGENSISLQPPMIELGSTPHDYEPYNGNTITIAPNTPTTISMLDGINTFFTNSDVDVTVKYPSTNVTPLVAQETADLMALGVTPAETVAQQQQQLNEMGVN